MAWKPFAIALLGVLVVATLAAGLLARVTTAAPTPTATPIPALTVEAALTAFQAAGLRVLLDTTGDVYGCVRQPGLAQAASFGTDIAASSAFTVARYATVDQAEYARAACTGRLTNGYRHGAIVLISPASRDPIYYFAVLQGLR